MNWPEQYNYVLRDVLKDVDLTRNSAFTSLANVEALEREVTAALSHVTLGMLTTGIAELDDNVLPSGYRVPFRWGQRSQFNWVDYCKHVAHELRKPAVIVQHYARYAYAGGSNVPIPTGSWCVHISRREYTKPLWAWFLLLPKAQIQSCTRYWRFYVYEGHQELIPAWRELCRTDPSFRAALRLSP